MGTLSYVHLRAGETPPPFADGRPFKTVVVAEQRVDPDWRMQVSRRLVEDGCLYVMVWGVDAADWDDSVDFAALERAGDDDRLVMSTWHDDQPLAEVFWFSEHCASDPDVAFARTLILHLAETAREAELLALYASARQTIPG